MTELDAMLREIENHHRDNPQHGVNCDCMDKYIRRLRSLTKTAIPGAQNRIDYVIRAAVHGAPVPFVSARSSPQFSCTLRTKDCP